MVFKGFLFEICENNYLRFLMGFILKYNVYENNYFKVY